MIDWARLISGLLGVEGTLGVEPMFGAEMTLEMGGSIGGDAIPDWCPTGVTECGLDAVLV